MTSLSEYRFSRIQVSTAVRQKLVGTIVLAPELWRGAVRTPDELSRKVLELASLPSAFGSDVEGVYLRFERGDHLAARAKYRKAGFQPGWRDDLPKRNRLAPQN